jgi:type II secretory pathway pseudopilin PulG
MSNGSTVQLERKVHLHRGERGYNLIEVIIAMGLLASVLISVFTLFFMGRYNVYAGREMTQAIALGNRVLEDMAPLNKKMIYNGIFALNDTDTGSQIIFSNPSQTYNNSRIRSTDPNVYPGAPDIQTQTYPTPATSPNFIAPASPGPAGIWTNLLAGKFNKGSITVILTPRNDTAGNSPAQFGTCATMRIRVLVRWIERNRQRQVALDTVKSY